MPDENAIVQLTEEKIVAAETEIGGGMWGSPVEKKPDDKPIAEIKKPDDKPIDSTGAFDESVYLKNNYGYDNPDTLKKELEELKDLREKAKTPAEIKFANEETKKFASYFTEEGKEEELLTHLQSKKLIDKAEKTNVENPKEATDLLQTYYKFKYKDFNNDEVRDHFNDQYSKPAKPKQTDTQDDDEYKEQVDEWKVKCDAIDRRIIRDAKMVKPEFSQFKSQIVLSDIVPKQQAATNKQPTQEELDTAKKVAEGFLQDVESGVKKLTEISTLVKDEAVEIPISYAYTDDERKVVLEQAKAFVSSNYDANAIFGKMWTDKDGHIDIARMLDDLAYLNSRQQINQKLANDAAGKRLREYTKDKKNIHLDGSGNNSNGAVDHAKVLEQVEAAIWEGKK